MSFKDKVVIVTGAGSGIGAATVRFFAKEKAKVTLVDINAENLKRTEKCKELSGIEALSIVADISKEEEAKEAVRKTVEHYGRLDVLVNNAGIGIISHILDTDYISVFDRIIAINLRAVAVTTNAAMPHLIKSKGNIVNVSSIGGTVVHPSPGMSIYSTSKAALNHFSRCVAAEVASKGVRINVVSPGPVRTDMHKSIGVSEEQFEEVGKLSPLGFMIESEEVGELILYLASDKAKSITGSVFVIDVGSTLKL